MWEKNNENVGSRYYHQTKIIYPRVKMFINPSFGGSSPMFACVNSCKFMSSLPVLHVFVVGQANQREVKLSPSFIWLRFTFLVHRFNDRHIAAYPPVVPLLFNATSLTRESNDQNVTRCCLDGDVCEVSFGKSFLFVVSV